MQDSRLEHATRSQLLGQEHQLEIQGRSFEHQDEAQGREFDWRADQNERERSLRDRWFKAGHELDKDKWATSKGLMANQDRRAEESHEKNLELATKNIAQRELLIEEMRRKLEAYSLGAQMRDVAIGLRMKEVNYAAQYGQLIQGLRASGIKSIPMPDGSAFKVPEEDKAAQPKIPQYGIVPRDRFVIEDEKGPYILGAQNQKVRITKEQAKKWAENRRSYESRSEVRYQLRQLQDELEANISRLKNVDGSIKEMRDQFGEIPPESKQAYDSLMQERRRVAGQIESVQGMLSRVRAGALGSDPTEGGGRSAAPKSKAPGNFFERVKQGRAQAEAQKAAAEAARAARSAELKSWSSSFHENMQKEFPLGDPMRTLYEAARSRLPNYDDEIVKQVGYAEDAARKKNLPFDRDHAAVLITQEMMKDYRPDKTPVRLPKAKFTKVRFGDKEKAYTLSYFRHKGIKNPFPEDWSAEKRAMFIEWTKALERGDVSMKGDSLDPSQLKGLGYGVGSSSIYRDKSPSGFMGKKLKKKGLGAPFVPEFAEAYELMEKRALESENWRAELFGFDKDQYSLPLPLEATESAADLAEMRRWLTTRASRKRK